MKQRLKKLVAMLGIAVLVSSQTVTTLANESGSTTEREHYIPDSLEEALLLLVDNNSDENEILPITSAIWDESNPGGLLIDNPNPEGVEITYIAKLFRDGENLIDSYYTGTTPIGYDSFRNYIYELGNYQVVMYMFPGYVDYHDAYFDTCPYVFTSDVYTYERPEISLPMADNITLYSNGILTWDAIDSEYVESYYMRLFEIDNGAYNSVLEKYIYSEEFEGSDRCEIDISDVFDSSKEYGIKFNAFSSNIAVVANMSEQDYSLQNIMEIEITDVEDVVTVLPMENLVWEDTILVCDNPNMEDVWVFFELTKDGELISTTDIYCDVEVEWLEIDCDEDITESGEYEGTIYVLSGEYSYEEALERYATEGLVSVSDILICTVTEPESREPESSEPESSEPESSELESSEPESSEPESSELESSEPESSEPESSEEESSEEESSSEKESSTEESKTASKPATSSKSSSKPAVKPAPQKAVNTVEVIEEIIPLASSIEETGYSFVHLLLSNNKAPLTSKQLSKYFGKDMILQAHLGNGVGFTIDAKTLSATNAEMNISTELIELDTFAEGFKTLHVKPFKAAKLGQEVGIHINVGQEFIGKKAYVYMRNMITGKLELVEACDVNASGNVGFYIDTMSDIVVMIEK